jgi:transcriptional regulator with XRE-family HTH domain
MKERLKELRKALGLKQYEFAKKLNIKRTTYTNYETGHNNPTDAVIGLICRTFNVNEKWLRTGEGEMFIDISRDQQIFDFMNKLEVDDSEFKRQFINMLCNMTEEEWSFVEKKMYELVDESRQRAAKKEAIASQDYDINDTENGLEDTTLKYEKRSTIKSEERYRKALTSVSNKDSSVSNTTDGTEKDNKKQESA